MRGIVVCRKFSGEESYLWKVIDGQAVWTSDHSRAINCSPTDIGCQKAGALATEFGGYTEFEPEDEKLVYKLGPLEWDELRDWLKNNYQDSSYEEEAMLREVLRHMDYMEER